MTLIFICTCIFRLFGFKRFNRDGVYLCSILCFLHLNYNVWIALQDIILDNNNIIVKLNSVFRVFGLYKRSRENTKIIVKDILK